MLLTVAVNRRPRLVVDNGLVREASETNPNQIYLEYADPAGAGATDLPGTSNELGSGKHLKTQSSFISNRSDLTRRMTRIGVQGRNLVAAPGSVQLNQEILQRLFESDNAVQK